MSTENNFQKDEIMTLAEIARYVKVSEKTILKLVQDGQIPGAKVSNQWRFMRDVIDDWLISKMQMAPQSDLMNVIGNDQQNVPLGKLISAERIILDIKCGHKKEILQQLMAPLVNEGVIKKPAIFLRSLLDREATISTSIGHGIAVPHLRYPDEKNVIAPCMVIGICREGVDYDSLDGEDTNIFIMPCAPSETMHLRIMAKLSIVFRKPDASRRFLEATSPKQVVKILKEYELAINDNSLGTHKLL